MTPPATEMDVSFIALLNLLGQMSAQLIKDERVAEARGIIDALGSLETKTQGNLETTEEQLLSTILTQLRMAVVQSDGSDSPPDSDSTEEPPR